MNNEQFEFELYYIAVLLGVKSPNTLSNKANKEEWPHYKVQRPGRHQKIYNLGTLPDLVQIGWAKWNEAAREKAMIEAKDKGKEYKLPPAVSLELAYEVLNWPYRKNFYAEGTKTYDGNSSGLCHQAREILEERFGKELKKYKGAKPAPANDWITFGIAGEEVIKISGTYLYGKLAQEEGTEVFLHPSEGDAMAPAIQPGQNLLVRKAGKIQGEGRIWLFQMNKEVFVRRVIKDPLSGNLILKAENPDYPSTPLEAKDLKKVKVLGQVIGSLSLDRLD